MKNSAIGQSLRYPVLAAVCALPLAMLSGCGRAPVPEYHLNMVMMVDKRVPSEDQKKIATILEAMFGTPDNPYVLPESGLSLAKIEKSAGPVWSDRFGKSRGLYRQHCGHCHGTTGDGMGPTAAILNPYPRDYRQGKFKFKSTERAAMPTTADLTRVLHEGVNGTAMPSFVLLPQDEIESLVEYVRYLSMRGMTEIALVNAFGDLGEGESLPETKEFLVGEILGKIADDWKTAPEKIINPPTRSEGDAEKEALAASVLKGRELFYGAVANCIKCHGPTALGDGQTNDYDDWNKPIHELELEIAKGPANIADRRAELAKDKDLSPEDRKKRVAEIDADELRYSRLATLIQNETLPVRTITPRNLRQGIYRGGRRPLDLYRRASAGINGTPMPGVGPATAGAQGTVKPEEIWNLIDYVRSLPQDPLSKPIPAGRVRAAAETVDAAPLTKPAHAVAAPTTDDKSADNRSTANGQAVVERQTVTEQSVALGKLHESND